MQSSEISHLLPVINPQNQTNYDTELACLHPYIDNTQVVLLSYIPLIKSEIYDALKVLSESGTKVQMFS